MYTMTIIWPHDQAMELDIKPDEVKFSNLQCLNYVVIQVLVVFLTFGPCVLSLLCPRHACQAEALELVI